MFGMRSWSIGFGAIPSVAALTRKRVVTTTFPSQHSLGLLRSPRELEAQRNRLHSLGNWNI